MSNRQRGIYGKGMFNRPLDAAEWIPFQVRVVPRLAEARGWGSRYARRVLD